MCVQEGTRGIRAGEQYSYEQHFSELHAKNDEAHMSSFSNSPNLIKGGLVILDADFATTEEAFDVALNPLRASYHKEGDRKLYNQ